MPQLEFNLHRKQAVAYTSPANEILYGGAAGGGKSHLIRVVANTLCMSVKRLQVYILRRISDDLYLNHMEGPGGFFSMLAPLFASGEVKYNGSKMCITFVKTGSKIWLKHCQHEKDVYKFQGAEIHVLLIDELTHFTEFQYRFLRSRCRIPDTFKIPKALKGKLPLVLCGSNPGNAGHTWVRRLFVTAAAPFTINQQTQDEGGMRRQYIPARLDDNPSLNKEEYAGKLSGLGSPALVKAMLEGDWNIVAGGALDDLWVPEVLIKPSFQIPKTWRISRCFDWGSTKPFYVGWYAKTNGEEVQLEYPDDRIESWCPEPNSLVFFREWYGTKVLGSNVGLKMSASDVGKGIKERETRLLKNLWIQTKVKAGPADNSIFNEDRNLKNNARDIAMLMAKQGINWTRSNKKPGSRHTGLQMMRDYIENSLKGEGPGLYFTEDCTAATSTLPVLPRDPKDQEDVDSASEDHPYDGIRYALLNERKPAAEEIETEFPS